jgi:hypothetical protein
MFFVEWVYVMTNVMGEYACLVEFLHKIYVVSYFRQMKKIMVVILLGAYSLTALAQECNVFVSGTKRQKRALNGIEANGFTIVKKEQKADWKLILNVVDEASHNLICGSELHGRIENVYQATLVHKSGYKVTGNAFCPVIRIRTIHSLNQEILNQMSKSQTKTEFEHLKEQLNPSLNTDTPREGIHTTALKKFKPCEQL